MNTFVLVGAALVVPFVWGWLTHWMLERIWPARDVDYSPPSPPPADFLDFQI